MRKRDGDKWQREGDREKERIKHGTKERNREGDCHYITWD